LQLLFFDLTTEEFILMTERASFIIERAGPMAKEADDHGKNCFREDGISVWQCTMTASSRVGDTLVFADSAGLVSSISYIVTSRLSFSLGIGANSLGDCNFPLASVLTSQLPASGITAATQKFVHSSSISTLPLRCAERGCLFADV
jgi:hypothetical protein